MKRHLKSRKWKKIIEKSGLFDVKYYLFTYPDVRKKNAEPIAHYIKHGAKEGRNPSEEFNTLFYLESNPDVVKSGINPLVHYILHGRNEGRNPMIRKIIKEVNKNGFKSTINKINSKANKMIQNKQKNILEDFSFQFQQNNEKDKQYINFQTKDKIETDIKLIAFYLPQFHPIEQNDTAWGKGFTEWTNVTKALPQFKGHYQPRLAGELGYYDLRLKEVQKRQIELAKNYGLYGFCYHYYWFDGKKVMDTPLQNILDNKDLDFPFCINWANENWTKRWDGLDNEVILKQDHTPDDDLSFLKAIGPILRDSRYIRINNKALLMIYRPALFPNIKKTVQRWRTYARESGIGELYLVLTHAFEHTDPKTIGFDAATEFAPNSFPLKDITDTQEFFNSNYSGNIYDYKSAINHSMSFKKQKYTKFRSLCPSWDNEARKPGKGTTLLNASPNSYKKWLEYILYYTHNNLPKEEQLVFVNAWNEWAEGAYLEPDRKFGYGYLNTTYSELQKFSIERLQLLSATHTKKKIHDTAVIIHLYYIELWNEMVSNLRLLDEKFDLYVNVNNNCDLNFLKQIKKEFPNITIFSYENRGRDILPFINILEYILPLDYRYCCKIHTKKSPHRVDGDQWRNHLIDSLLSTKERIDIVKSYLNNNTGIVVAKGNIFSYNEWIGSNATIVENFANNAKIRIPDDFYFPAGSMFWFKPFIFKKLVEHIDKTKFIYEDEQIDGTKAHAIERIFGLLCVENNLTIKEI